MISKLSTKVREKKEPENYLNHVRSQNERLKDAKQLKQLQQEKKTLTEVKDKINSDPAQA